MGFVMLTLSIFALILVTVAAHDTIYAEQYHPADRIYSSQSPDAACTTPA